MNGVGVDERVPGHERTSEARGLCSDQLRLCSRQIATATFLLLLSSAFRRCSAIPKEIDRPMWSGCWLHCCWCDLPKSVRILAVLASLLTGAFVGASGFTFVSAKGASYLTDDPAVCVNCHIMRDEYAGWQRSSHHTHATCNDSHLPHDNVLH